MFWDNFWPNFASDAITTLILGAFVGFILYKIQRNSDDKKEKELRREKLHLAIELLYGEINYNRNQLQVIIEQLKIPNLPFPALEIGIWEVLDKQLILDGLKKKDIKHIISIYARTKTINTIYDELVKNSSWMLDIPNPKIKKVFMDMLIDRCQELLDYINEVFPAGAKEPKG